MRKHVFYFVLAFFTIGIVSCEEEENEKIDPIQVETGSVVDRDYNSITINGKIIEFGKGIDTFGHCWSTNPVPTLEDEKTVIEEEVSGSYQSEIEGLTDDTKYYIRAYAMNEEEITYGEIEEVTTDINTLKIDLVAYYSFSGNANDYSINSYNGTIYGATLTTDRFGNENSAFSFDGVDDYIDCGNDIIFNQDVTISLWYNCSDQDKNNFILDKYNWEEPWQSGVGISADISDIRFSGRNNTDTYYSVETSNANITDGKWRNVIGIIRNNVWELWVDGILISTVNSINGEVNNEDNLIIGNLFVGFEDQNRYFNGLIDDVRIYNRALAETEINQLYHEGGWDL